MEVPARRILVIDDDPSFLRLCQVMLPSEGYECLTSDGHESDATLAVYRPDAIMLDLRLLGGEGIERLKQIKAVGSPLAGVPVVVCTASLDLKGTFAPQLEELATGILDKPFSIEGLLDILERATTPAAVERADYHPASP